MRIIASGHPGLNQYLKDTYQDKTVIAEDWKEVCDHVGEADGILLGESLHGFPQALQDAPSLSTAYPSLDWVVWLSDATEVPLWDSAVTVWRGEILAERLEAWYETPTVTLQSVDIPARFLMLSCYPYDARQTVAEWLTREAHMRHGSGGWVDLDWQGAFLTLTYLPRVTVREAYPFHQMRPLRVEFGQLVPAPPPWQPHHHLPEMERLNAIWREGWSWQGWDAGSYLGNPAAIHMMTLSPTLVMAFSATTPPDVLARSLDFCRLYNPAASLGAISRGGISGEQDRVIKAVGAWGLSLGQSSHLSEDKKVPWYSRFHANKAKRRG